MTPPIVVAHVGKQFRVHQPDRPWTIQEAVARGLRRSAPPQSFWALRDVSFSVGAGRTVGLVGGNGSGKSTMLRLIGGVGRPDSGRIQASGRICALLDLGAGFHPDLTGRENCVLAGILNGLSRREVLDRMDAIVAFAEIERAIDAPVRTFSTGMRMRLAFAVAVHAEPDILLIDEVLAVGDVTFQRKCLDRIAAFKAAGCSIVFVSHEAAVVAELCDDAVWLKSGRLVADGNAQDVVRDYLRHMQGDRVEEVSRPPEPEPARAVDAAVAEAESEPTHEVRLLAVRVYDVDGAPVSELRSGDAVRIDLEYMAPSRVRGPMFHVRVSREDDLVCLDLTTERTVFNDALMEGPGRVSVWLDRLDVNSGRYRVSAGCHSHDWAHLYEQLHDAYAFVVHGHQTSEAIMSTPQRWEFADGARR